MSDPEKFMQPCDVCGSSFQYGPHRYAGRWLPRYQMLACDACLRGNHDGWGPVHEPRVLGHLERKGIEPPPRNEQGWLPLE
jgi:hypothetical protein